MLRRHILSFLLPGILLVLAGCETLAPRVAGEDTAAWDARRERLQAMEKWSLEGRIAIRTADDGQSANLSWEQEGDHFQAQLFGPFGAGNTRIIGTAEELLLQTADGDELYTRNPERDLYWELGWTVPLEQMPYWVRGLPGPGKAENVEIDGAGRLQSLRQGQWTLEIPQYIESEGGEIMPRKVTLQRKDVRIRLIIDEWNLPSDETAAMVEPAARQ